mgnify:CR=1 FL=1
MKKSLIIFLILFLSGLIHTDLIAQEASITFHVNLQPELKDSTFVPGRDFIEITGDVFPFSKSGNRLKDDSVPADSIYSITLNFDRFSVNKTYAYNFIMNINGQPRKESMPRQVAIRPGEHELDALYFDAFAW